MKEEKEKALNSLLEGEENLAHDIIRLDEELKKYTEEVISEGRKLDAKQNEFNLTKSLLEKLIF